jgi:hypothetical protein
VFEDVCRPRRGDDWVVTGVLDRRRHLHPSGGGRRTHHRAAVAGVHRA